MTSPELFWLRHRIAGRPSSRLQVPPHPRDGDPGGAQPEAKPACAGFPGLSRSGDPYLLWHPGASLEGAAQVPVRGLQWPPGPEGPHAWRRCSFTALSPGSSRRGTETQAGMEPGAAAEQPGQTPAVPRAVPRRGRSGAGASPIAFGGGGRGGGQGEERGKAPSQCP